MRNHNLWAIRALLAVVILIMGMSTIACGDDDDDNDDSDNPDVDDDADDDVNDDADDDVDDDVNDDLNDDLNDDVDDDADDDDDWPLPPPSYGWILMDTNRQNLSDTMQQAVDYGMDNVHLSHSLIMNIDQINDDEDRAILLQDVAQEAHALGLEVWVWAHEFNEESQILLCFDSEDPMWERRADEYRQALERIPEIDGVVLMTGSADVEPWYVPCICDWCRDLPPTDNPLLNLLNSRPADRVQQIYDAVGGVVMHELGKKLRMRTFLHQPMEVVWLGESLREYDDPDLMVMSKDVPQDWVPYYPHNPLIGDVGHRHQIIEMDLGNEYWGKNRILNSQVDYIYMRYQYDLSRGARGAAARIERGSDHTLGTANEINIFAFSQYMLDDEATPDQVYRDWFSQRYGIASDSADADTLKTLFRNSHFAMRKMYYTLGMWTLEKGSDIPDSALYPQLLWARNTAFYDPDWLGVFTDLVFPDKDTLMRLWQESLEARELATDNLALLESVEGAFAEPVDYQELHDMLELHEDCTEIWQYVIDTTYRWVAKSFGLADADTHLEFNARRLLELADAMEVRWGAGVSPGNPGRIRDFVADLRGSFPEQPDAENWEQMRVFNVEAVQLGGGQVRVTWETDETATQMVEWSRELPLYENTTGEQEVAATQHSVDINVDEPGERHVYSVASRGPDGDLIYSGDFWFGLDP